MTMIEQYVEYGVNLQELLTALKASLATIREPKGKRVYVGIPNKSKHIPDGTDWGCMEKRAGMPMQLFQALSDYGLITLHEKDTGRLWYTGNGNATLSPWDSAKLLRQYEAKGVVTDKARLVKRSLYHFKIRKPNT